MQFTTVPQKFFASALNAMTVLIITSPLLLLLGFTWEWKLTTIIIFFLYEIILLATKDKRDFGMVLVKSYWREPFTIFQYIIYNVFYTLSFATLFFYIIFPGDILILNLLFIQLPLVIFTKSTLHGCLSGMATIQ
jgi:hypothetical protein